MSQPSLIAHLARALRAVVGRELLKFLRQPSRLASSLVRPLLWFVVFSAGFHNVFGVAIIPPYETYVEYKVYMLPGLLGMIALFNGMQSSLSMVYDREMGVMRLLLTAPLPRGWLLGFKLVASTTLSLLQMLVFLLIALAFGVEADLASWLLAIPVMALGATTLAALGLMLSVYIKQLENFAGTMNFVIFQCSSSARRCTRCGRWRSPGPCGWCKLHNSTRLPTWWRRFALPCRGSSMPRRWPWCWWAARCFWPCAARLRPPARLD